jgi:hypothetical protein
MASETRIWCDKCGEQISEDRTKLVAKTGPLRFHEPIDFCSTCSAEFTEWLGASPGRKPTRPTAVSRKRSTAPPARPA